MTLCKVLSWCHQQRDTTSALTRAKHGERASGHQRCQWLALPTWLPGQCETLPVRLHTRAGGSASLSWRPGCPACPGPTLAEPLTCIPLVTRPMGSDNRPTVCGGISTHGELQTHSGTTALESEDHRAGRAQVGFSVRTRTVCVCVRVCPCASHTCTRPDYSFTGVHGQQRSDHYDANQ